MKKALIINALILITAIPISGIVAWITQLADFGARYVGYSTFEMILLYTFAPVTSGIITSHDLVQNAVLGGPPILFTILLGISLLCARFKLSYLFSCLLSACWVIIVMIDIVSRAMP